MKKLVLFLSSLLPIPVMGQSTAPYTIKDQGYVLLEAETLSHSDRWELVPVSGNKNVGGGAYLKYTGPVSGSGYDQEIDRDGTLQGEEKDWLIIPVNIQVPGRYRINLKNHHMNKDGDNDIWVHIKGWELPVRRVGDHGVDTYQWLTWGPDWVYFDIEEAGVYEFYVAGRSKGFGVDRIAIYNESAPVSVFFRDAKTAN